MVKASNSSSLVQGQGLEGLSPTTSLVDTQSSGDAVSRARTQERERESLFLGGEGLMTHCRKTFDNFLSQLCFI